MEADMEIFSLKGKTAIVVGGSRGLGKGIAAGLALAGASVALCSRKKADLDAAAAEITEKTMNGDVIGIPADITSREGIDGLVAQTVEAFGQIDVLVNGAGVNVRKPALEFTEEDWDRVQDTQLKYVFFMSQAAARHMKERGRGGKIINIASLSSQIGLPNMVSYCCAKGGVAQMTKALANELAAYGVNVNAIGPGYYETEMTKPLFEDKAYLAKLLSRIPMNRTGFPEDLMGAAVFLASRASDYVTGQVVYVDGGWLAC
jgi:NAD(P)-dependent dehydrogenase (short-subunit alcohol dehydrogenase family)